MSDLLGEVIQIRQISAEACWPIRQEVMWPEKDIEFVKLEKDESGIHYGLFLNQKLSSIISLFIEGNEAQFRKFATLKEEQGRGLGSKLLGFLLVEIERYPVRRIYCNARIERSAFYESFGLKKTEVSFERAGRSYIIMEKQLN